MRLRLIAVCLGLAACADSQMAGPAPLAGEAPNGAQQAYFAAYPAPLFVAAAETCDGPGQSVVQPSRNEVRCESLPDPESAAAIILQFDGTVEDIPTFVISFAGRQTEAGYLVTADNYIRVPQRRGGVQQIRFPDPDIADDVAELLRAAGGRPL